MNINFYKSLVKRELLEHKSAIVITPMVFSFLGVITALLILWAAVSGGDNNLSDLQNGFSFSDSSFQKNNLQNNSFQNNGDGNSTTFNTEVITMPFYLISLIVSVFYLMDTLLSDRRNKSILFWRSLPVSEELSVMAKLFVAVFAIPTIFFAFGFATEIVMTIILRISEALTTSGENTHSLVNFNIVHSIQALLASIIISVMLVPVYLTLLFISALVKKAPFLFVILPLIGISIIEKVILNKVIFVPWIGQYIGAVFRNTNALFDHGSWHFSAFSIVFGLVVSCVIYFGTVWLRKNRFEI
ncbi:MAG: ABC-2 type transport system permease protein [Flavobacteriales bacterium]|jgi:ABC-2 type transport system permease protein